MIVKGCRQTVWMSHGAGVLFNLTYHSVQETEERYVVTVHAHAYETFPSIFLSLFQQLLLYTSSPLLFSFQPQSNTPNSPELLDFVKKSVAAEAACIGDTSLPLEVELVVGDGEVRSAKAYG